jgi:hypothetical protein
LEGDIRQGFGLEDVAQPEYLIRQLAVRAFALGG